LLWKKRDGKKRDGKKGDGVDLLRFYKPQSGIARPWLKTTAHGSQRTLHGEKAHVMEAPISA
jgi:hypothetical protein